jgi:hypothetical protein
MTTAGGRVRETAQALGARNRRVVTVLLGIMGALVTGALLVGIKW